MKKTAEILKPFREHIIILLAFVAISFLYFSPIFEGKQLRQMDYEHALGMSKELVDFEKTHPGEYSLWTNSMFGGMPAYQIKSGPVNNIYLQLFYLNLRFDIRQVTHPVVIMIAEKLRKKKMPVHIVLVDIDLKLVELRSAFNIY